VTMTGIITESSDDLPGHATLDEHLRSRHFELEVKRCVDVVLATSLFLLLSPILLAAALAIRLDSPGPAVFAQRRWGRGGSIFMCYKFRSMHAASSEPETPTERASAAGYLAKSPDDPRVTRVGRILRRTSVDELPQLWNVIVGDMSLVGPRPLMVHMLAPYSELRELRCRLRPGITGLWQVSARANNTHVMEMLSYDLEYLQRFGLLLDARIMMRTFGAVIRGDGAV
jgi:exopolysaccharide production protein ExoY